MDGDIIKYVPNVVKDKKQNEDSKNEEVKIENQIKEIDDSKYNKKVNSNNEKKVPKSSFFLFFLMVLLAVSSVMFAYKNYKNLNQESYSVYSSIDEDNVKNENKTEEEQSAQSNNKDVIQKQENQNQVGKSDQKSKSATNIKNPTKTQTPKIIPLNFVKPIDGEVQKIYSKDKVIYSKTLELWKTHEGIDIKANENAIVKSIEKGTVEKIYDDSFYGKTVVIDHGQGYKSSYSNLSEDIFVKEKQVITKLTKIGKIGKTAIGEIKDDSHLHFALMKNNVIIDPSSIFK